MAYNQQLADRIRKRLADLDAIEEKPMMGGLVFMYNGKMCVGIMKDELMCRIDPEEQEDAVETPGCRMMELGGKTMKGYILVDDTAMNTQKQFDYWIGLALAYNPKAKATKKKR
jgi:TfoX/Sxy family transcriptional regulator of competence genes